MSLPKALVFVEGTNQEVCANNTFISSSGRFFVSGINAQRNKAFVKLEMTNSRKYAHLSGPDSAGSVIWPIKVLNANEVITPIETPFERVLVSHISAGIIHERLPQVKEKETW